jgi:hypothetical protein
MLSLQLGVICGIIPKASAMKSLPMPCLKNKFGEEKNVDRQ